VTRKEVLDFVKHHGVVLQAARGPVPSLAEKVTGAPIRGSWWAHPQARDIYSAAQYACDSPDVLVCKLVDGKLTYVHRRLWPALAKLSTRFRKPQLAKVWDEHTSSGKHVAKRMPYPKWLPDDAVQAAEEMSVEEAEELLAPLFSKSKA